MLVGNAKGLCGRFLSVKIMVLSEEMLYILYKT